MPCLLLSELLSITKRMYNELRLFDDKSFGWLTQQEGDWMNE